MKKTAKQHLLANKQPKKVLMDKDFAGIKAGQMMLVATPQLVNQYIQSIPYGQSKTVVQLRKELAEQHDCDACCPVSTAIFVRICAQAAIDEMDEGKSTEQVTPFWRLLSSQDKISKKLTIDAEWLDNQRHLELL